MTEKNCCTTGIDKLRDPAKQPVALLLEMLQRDIGDNMTSLCVVGSALTDDFHPKFSDINTVLVVSRRSHELLQLLAGYGKKLAKLRLAAPLLMTEEYISQSADVFAIELLDFQLYHAVIYGKDPFSAISIAKGDIRHQCERQLKAALIQLRQGYISAMGKPKPLAQLLLACAAELTVLLRTMLWLTDHERPAAYTGLPQAAAEAFDCDLDKLKDIVFMKLSRKAVAAELTEDMFASVYQITDQLARQVDMIGDQS